MPFDDDEDGGDNTPKKGLKIKNNPAASTPKIIKQEFDQKVNAFISKQDEYKTRFADLAKQYKTILQDNTLVENKTKLAIEVENGIVNNLIKLADEINRDDTQEEGQGSIGLLVLFAKCQLSQRDEINALRYKLEKLSK